MVYVALQPRLVSNNIRLVTVPTAKPKIETVPWSAAPALSLPQPQDIPQVIDLLRSDFVDARQLLSQNLSSDTVSTWWPSLGKRVALSTESVINYTPLPEARAEAIAPKMGYIRLHTLGDASMKTFLKAWSEWQKTGCNGLILDLREFQDRNNFESATDMASLFTNPNKILFSLQGLKVPQKVFQTRRQPLSLTTAFPILVLINENTRGAGEALAYLLQQKARALLVGQLTAGEMGTYEEKKLPTGNFFRYATSEVVLPSGDNLLGKPLIPDVMVSWDAAEQSRIFRKELEKGAAGMIKEVAIAPRPNEAALVRDEEWNEKAVDTEPEGVDKVLRAAVDIIHGVWAFQESPSIAPEFRK